ncbi:hypothetical protein COLO4_30561 [Corchorus olitorius]|uniref:Protein kinase domain-containing protein n=1 Tax=Corchorus olitorius TaxID=93759 RepID=A0A1R3H7W2_9ROSI|nr:hypothetical protein COLO4_30561 [Corchorus olitorius]
MDIIHVLQANHLHVCLVNTGNGIPLISALELRLLNSTTYRTQTGSLELFTRYDVGSTTRSTFRFKDDAYDRIWWPYIRKDWTQISTSSTVGSEEDQYEPPSLAMSTAGTPVNASQSLDFYIDSTSLPNAQFYLYMHFAEVEKLLPNETRAFNISYNGKYWYGPLSPAYLSSNTLYTRSALTGGDYRFSIYKTADSTHPPILNAIEVYMVKEFLQSETIQEEASAASLAILIVALGALWLKRRKLPAVGIGQNTNDEHQNLACISDQSLESRNRQFTFSEVQKMTNNFTRVLGKGGFGTVFHGYLDNRTEVAVKMLSHSSVQGYKQFQAEVKLLLRVHHRNLTSLIGYCNEGTNLGLIYEYMAKGNLAEHLSGRGNRILNWEERLRTTLEAAQGGTHVSASIAGTPGYLDPEYYTSNRLTEKSDVYSFGIVLLEVISGRPVISETNNERTHISQWVSSLLSRGDVNNIVDPRLQGDFDVNSVWKAVELAMSCLTYNSTRRPNMNEVATELTQCLSKERARRMRGQENESQDSVGMISMNLGTTLSPLPR